MTAKSKRLPLSGVRILEAGTALAVPAASRLLADYGAEIVKVESVVRPEIGRVTIFANNNPGEMYWEKGGFYTEANRNKFGVSLDLSKPDARAVFLDLVKVSDVMVENFTPRVMNNFGLTYDKLAAINPDIIMLSSTGYGHDGPWRDYRAYGFASEPTTGITHHTGYEGGPPVRSVISYTDTPASYIGAFAILTALEYRARTGKGQWIDLSQYEAGVAFGGEGPLNFQLAGDPGGRHGNHDITMAPHNSYRCRGADQWLAIAVRDDDDWQRLCRTIGRADLAANPAYATVLGRRQHEAAIDEALASWAAEQDARTAMCCLQGAGVPAGMVLDTREAFRDPQLWERGFYQRVTHQKEIPGLGDRLYPSAAWTTAEGRPPIQRPAPMLGEHTAQVLGGLLGMSDEAIAQLAAANITGTVPHGVKRVNFGQFNNLDDLQRLGIIRDYDLDFRERLGIAPEPADTLNPAG